MKKILFGHNSKVLQGIGRRIGFCIFRRISYSKTNGYGIGGELDKTVVLVISWLLFHVHIGHIKVLLLSNLFADEEVGDANGKNKEKQ